MIVCFTINGVFYFMKYDNQSKLENDGTMI